MKNHDRSGSGDDKGGPPLVYVKQHSDKILGTLDKGLHVLQVIADSDVPNGPTLTELSNEVGIHRTTLFRILSTLESRNFVARDPETDRYELGIGVLGIAATLLRNLSIREIARPTLAKLSESTGEVVFLTVRDRGEIVTVEAFESVQEISLRATVGDRRPMHCTASGKAILAYLPAIEVDKILQGGMPVLTSRTITSAVVMGYELDKVRGRGFAWDDEERIEGVRCVAAPVFDSKGDAIAAISLAAPTMRTSFDRMLELGGQMKEAADTISAQYGFGRISHVMGSATDRIPHRSDGPSSRLEESLEEVVLNGQELTDSGDIS